MSKPLSSRLPARRGVKPDAVLPAEDAATQPVKSARVPGTGDPERLLGCVRLEKDRALQIPLAKLAPDPVSVRDSIDPAELESLAASIRSQGVIEPLVVWWDPASRLYRVLSGERRLLAARQLGIDRLPCLVDTEAALELEDVRLLRRVVANVQRQDLEPLELARTLEYLTRRHGRSTRQLAAETGLSPASVSRSLALLGLPAPVQDLVESGGLAPATAYELVRLPGPGDQVELALTAAQDGLSRSQVRAAVDATLAAPAPEELFHGETPNLPEPEPEATPPGEPPPPPMASVDRILMRLLCPDAAAEATWEALAGTGATDFQVEQVLESRLGSGGFGCGSLDGLDYSYRGGRQPALWIGWHRGRSKGPVPRPTFDRRKLIARVRELLDIPVPGALPSLPQDPEPAPAAPPPAETEPSPPVPELPVPEVSPELVTLRRSSPFGLPMGFELRPRPGVLVTVYFEPGADLAGRSDPGGVLREAAELADRFDPTADGAVEVKGG